MSGGNPEGGDPAIGLDPAQVYARVPGAQAGRFGEELVVLDGEGQVLRGLNRTAARTWELLDGRRSLAEVAQLLAPEFRVSPEVVLADLLPFVAALRDRRLVVKGGAP